MPKLPPPKMPAPPPVKAKATAKPITESLTKEERVEFSECEGVIKQGLSSFVEVGAALIKIRDRRFYKEQFSSFKLYASTKWVLSHRRLNQLIEGSAVVKQIESGNRGSQNAPILPNSERQCRELATVAPEKQAEAWQTVVDTAPKNDKGEPKISASHVRVVLEQARASKIEPPAGLKLKPEVAKALEWANQFKATKDKIITIQTEVKALAEGKYGTFMRLQQISTDLRNAFRALTFSAPYRPCPYCNQDGCETCHKGGWVCKGIYDAAPADLKAHAES